MSKVPDWSSANICLVREALRCGEARLAAQMQLAISADQRASVLAGIYAAIGTGIIAALASAADPKPYLLAGGIVMAVVFIFGGLLCILTTLPVGIWTPGYEPQAWYDDISNNKALVVALGELTASYNTHILENNDIITKNAGLFRWGALIGMAAPLLGAVTADVFFLLTRP